MPRPRVIAAAMIAVATVSAAAMQAMDVDAIQQAIAIGQSTIAADRARFHQQYRVVVGTAPVDELEVVTPFRRVELAAEQRLAAGDRRFGQRQALDVLDAAADRVDVYVAVTFSPLNTYVGVPDYTVTLTGAGAGGTIEPQAIDGVPRFGTRISGVPLPFPTPAAAPRKGRSEPMLGGTVIAHFDGRALMPAASYTVRIGERTEGGNREIARARIDLGAMR